MALDKLGFKPITIKRKPVLNPPVSLKYQPQVKTQQTYQIPRKPVSPVTAPPNTVAPLAAIGPVAATASLISGTSAEGKTAETPTRVENVDGNDYIKFLEKSKNGLIECQSKSSRIHGRENAASGGLRHTLNTAIRAEVPPAVENATNALAKREAPSTPQTSSGKRLENSEVRINNLSIENSAQEIPADEVTDIYEEFVYDISGESRTLAVISDTTLFKRLESHTRLTSETGSASDTITRKSVGPISRMLHKWLTSQELFGLPFHVPVDSIPGTTASLDRLFNNTASRDAYITYHPSPSFTNREVWNSLWKMAVCASSVCKQLFSISAPQDLMVTCSRIPRDQEGHGRLNIEELGNALFRELSDAIAKSWINKGYILLKAGIIHNGAQWILKGIYQSGHFTLDECHRFRNELLLGYWKQFLQNLKAPAPFANPSELFGVLQAFEKPHDPPKYFPDSHQDLQYLVMTSFSNSWESGKYQLVKQNDTYVYQEYLVARRRAIRNGEWEKAIGIIDQMLYSIYLGVEEAKRWLAVKAYLLAIIGDWNASIAIQQLLQQVPLNTNDRLRLEVYFTNSISALVHQRDLEASRRFCSAAMQLPDLEIPELERVCGRKNVDILYGILYPNAEVPIGNQEDHIRRLQKALAAWGQGGHLFEPDAPFHYLHDAFTHNRGPDTR
ncbi:hypothetical protein TWF730_000242 [Orbilia blumenaviensis]|uniref:Nuclear pore complex protein NUP96 C-terminal domain-containing protein n=1 Tax=Orbilia blumenaviensis TaxID=1796055 RepID=A0AAV9VL99_9PEZI